MTENLKRSKNKYIDKILLDKDKEINRLKNHGQIMLTEIKKLKCKDIQNFKFNKVTLTDLVQSQSSQKLNLKIKVPQQKNSKLKIKLALQMNFHYIAKEVSLVNEHPEIKLKPQLSDMSTSLDLVKV